MKYKVQYRWVTTSPSMGDAISRQWYDWTHGLTEYNVSLAGITLPSGIYANEEDGYFPDYLAASICCREMNEAIAARDRASVDWETQVVEVPDAV